MKRPIFDRWLSKVQLPSESERESACWIWTGAKTPDGYGLLHDGRNGRHGVEYAHILSCEFFCNVPTSAKVVRRHTCDVRCCVNPHHLICGTQAENMRDRVSHNRAADIDWQHYWRTGIVRQKNGEATNV